MNMMYVIQSVKLFLCVWVKNRGEKPHLFLSGQHHRATCEITLPNPCVISVFLTVEASLGTNVRSALNTVI